MENFEFYNPTKVIFGKDQLERLPELLNEFGASKILLVYGGGSIKQIGLFDQLMNVLNGLNVIEFGGVPPNPEYNVLMKAVQLAQDERVDFILAVGGGSVIDGVKFISGAIPYDGEPWDVLDKKEGAIFNKAIPFGTILTLPATGSEVNSGAVISRSELMAKRVMGGPQFFPKFSFCDPSLVGTLPKRQIANGLIDAYMHTLEQYLTVPTENMLQEREAEAILSTLLEVKDVIDQPDNYKLASNFMLAASHALNGNLRCGVPTDWATHMIGHELTAHFGLDHAQSLAVVGPRLFEHELEKKKAKLVQYGKRIFGLSGTDEFVAKEAIELTEKFFHQLGVKTRLSEYTNDYSGIEKTIRDTFVERGWTEMGESKSIAPSDIEDIVKATF